MTPDQILSATSAHFGRPVLRLTAPGGRTRGAFRAYFAEGSVIVTRRTSPAAAALEGTILSALAPLTPHVPRHLGRHQDLSFQEDAGADRLNWHIHTLPPDQRPALAAQAIAALFDLHRAARVAGLASLLPPQGLRRLKDEDLFSAARRLFVQLDHPPQGFNPAAFSEWFRLPPQAFTKCDCRAGNAALDPQGRLRFFDFEDARLGHGPEDFAWLLADESLPVEMGHLFRLVEQHLTPADTADRTAYLTYLQEYAVLQAIRRLRLIFAEARRRGWIDRITALKYDRVGTNPHLGEGLAETAARLAEDNAATRPLAPLLRHAAEVFRKVRRPPQPETGLVGKDES